MHVNSIILKHYRNYEYADVKLNKEINVLYGNNAQGKTNLLESIYLLTTGKSYRTKKDKELIAFKNPYAKISIHFHNQDGENTGEIILSSDQKKRIKINEVPINKIGQLMGFFNAVLFSPEDLELVKSGPSERRKFIDICISQLRPQYFYLLQQYIKILQQRNHLLKNISKKKELKDTLEVWDEKLIKTGVMIIQNRIIFIKQIRDLATQIHGSITQGGEKLEIFYQSNIGIAENVEDINELKKQYKNRLKQYQKREIEYGITLVGPHRDDICFMINGNILKMYGSQGQQRTVVLSLKMAEMEYIKENIGEYPVLLLDDIMSELDVNRQNYILNHIKNKQVIITCTSTDTFDKINENISFFHIEKGKVYGG